MHSRRGKKKNEEEKKKKKITLLKNTTRRNNFLFYADVRRAMLRSPGAASLRPKNTVFERLNVITIPYQHLLKLSVDEPRSVDSS